MSDLVETIEMIEAYRRIAGLSRSQQTILEAVLAKEHARYRISQATVAQARSQEVGEEAVATIERSRRTREQATETRQRATASRSPSESASCEHEMVIQALLGEIESLQEALRTRTVIANAVGLLMAWGRTDRDEAFDQLRRASQRINRKLRDVAAGVVEQHERRVGSHAESQRTLSPTVADGR